MTQAIRMPCRGMWVRLRVGDVTRTGIVAQLAKVTEDEPAMPANVAEVHIVDASGDTVLVMQGIPVAELTQARYQHIPDPRKPDLAVARRLGYV